MSQLAPALITVFALIAFASAFHADEPKSGPAKPLPHEELQRRLLQHWQDENPQRNVAPFSLKDLTTEAIWEQLKVQVVKVVNNQSTGQTYVIRKDDLVVIGESFGGDGVNSLCVADLNGDGHPLLLYSYNWGSGQHRSHIAALDCREKQPRQNRVPLTNYSFKDFKLKSLDARTVDVLAGDVKIGRLVLEKKDAQPMLRIRLEEEIPVAIRKELKASP